ncbi:helix-turn-helix transcriptional regulator [Novosphingobium sp. HII-3]|uniref:helix-turn-helix domain-containing protein n=1 Tax=Novosphingobium sp. HII-3 TaxID=2075565 RepID=UPI001304F094|nr:helix-turn-helix transcriptional regulator [Novosphingobium sp. HII-3]
MIANMVRHMDQQTIIAAMEARARKLGLSMSELCRRANVHPTTFSRWKLTKKNPEPIGASIKTLSALENVLKAAEAPKARRERAA